jgi:hypothetical protein
MISRSLAEKILDLRPHGMRDAQIEALAEEALRLQEAQRAAVTAEREACDERWRNVIRGLHKLEQERDADRVGAFHAALNSTSGEPANGTPLRAAVDAFRAK